uniref:Farnesyl pyrophosphate synthase n=1 Tax=Sphenodon punctatus TaxID=8508 RepID=A0A8D0LAJ8_SPHPU
MTEAEKQRVAADDDRQRFVEFFPQVIQDLTAEQLHHPEVGDAVARLKEVRAGPALGPQPGPGKGAPLRGSCSLHVGPCYTCLQAFFLVADDIMDYSVTRRGQPCWYKKEGIGLNAVNDAFLLEACVYQLLKRYCRGQPYYLNLLELFLQGLGGALSPQIGLGAGADPAHARRYKAIVKYKTGFYSFYLPVAAAMYMAGIDSEEEHAHAKAILLEMGEFFQIQDDFLDCFGDPSVTGKIGTDIQDNKCSWLVVACLCQASPEQRQLLEENYGQKEPEKVERVKQLYETLRLRDAYQACEESSYRRLQALIAEHAQHLPRQIFLGLTQKIYKRQK